jgi:RNA polymerase sigma factor for flagellar operon FliA
MRSRALILLHAAMSEVWEGEPVPADGGVRARNQQRAYVDRVTAGRGSPARSTAPAPIPPLPSPRPAGRHGWQTPNRFMSPERTARPA